MRFNTYHWVAYATREDAVPRAEAMSSAVKQHASEAALQRNERARRVKDIAVGAVLIVTAFSLVVADLVILNRP